MLYGEVCRIDDRENRELIKECAVDVINRLFAAADRDSQSPRVETIKITFEHDPLYSCFCAKGTMQTDPKPIEYKDCMRLYLDANFDEREAERNRAIMQKG